LYLNQSYDQLKLNLQKTLCEIDKQKYEFDLIKDRKINKVQLKVKILKDDIYLKTCEIINLIEKNQTKIIDEANNLEIFLNNRLHKFKINHFNQVDF